MPTIVFNPGDCFRYDGGFGFVLQHGMYLVAEGEGGRTGRKLRRTAILPRTVQPAMIGIEIPFVVKFAFKAVAVAGQFPYSEVLDN
jgi:hypothetical protein